MNCCSRESNGRSPRTYDTKRRVARHDGSVIRLHFAVPSIADFGTRLKGQTGGQVLEQPTALKLKSGKRHLTGLGTLPHTCTRDHHHRCLVEWRTIPKQLQGGGGGDG